MFTYQPHFVYVCVLFATTVAILQSTKVTKIENEDPTNMLILQYFFSLSFFTFCTYTTFGGRPNERASEPQFERPNEQCVGGRGVLEMYKFYLQCFYQMHSTHTCTHIFCIGNIAHVGLLFHFRVPVAFPCLLLFSFLFASCLFHISFALSHLLCCRSRF